MVAIENENIINFKNMGGHLNFDLNFEVSKDGLTPLMIASAKGK